MDHKQRMDSALKQFLDRKRKRLPTQQSFLDAEEPAPEPDEVGQRFAGKWATSQPEPEPPIVRMARKERAAAKKKPAPAPAPTMVHRSVKLEHQLWQRMTAKAHKHGFESVSAYLRHVIDQDVSNNSSVEQAEERLVATISKLAGQIKNLGTTQQATFATIWAVLEVLLETEGQSPEAIDRRLQQLRVRIAADVRSNVADFSKVVQ